MTFVLRFHKICAVAAIAPLIGFPSASGQSEAGRLPPELAPLEAKYDSALDALDHARTKAIAALRQSYLTALDAAEQRATSEGKRDELKAVTAEKETLAAGRALKAAAATWLPHALGTPRSYFLREMERAEHDYAAHAQLAAGEYLRGLAFYENKAKMAKQDDLLKLIEAEKLKITGQSPASPPSVRSTGENLVLNGDFTQKSADGMAENWKLGGKSQGAVTTDHGVSYLHFVNPDAKKEVFFQTVDRPPDAKELVVTVRMRSSDLDGHGEYGVVIWQLDAQDKQISRDMPVRATAPAQGWRTYSGTVKLLPDAKKIQFRGIIDTGLTGAVDYGDLRGEAR
jgi:hypothetical protein